MTDVAHTSGPWFVHERPSRIQVGARNDGGRLIDLVATMAITPGSRQIEIGLANARLIAAAPHMLDVLETCAADDVKMVNWSDEQIRGWAYAVARNARAVIARAKGEA